MIKNNMAILVIGFDGYSDLWGDFFTLFKKYWKDCPYNLYMANNKIDYPVDGVTFIHAGEDAEWSRKVQLALEQIDEEYICLLLEDFYLGRKVDTQIIENAIELMKQDDLKYYKLNTFTPFKTSNYKNIPYLHVIPENMEYGISLLPGIWNKDFLKQKLGTENYNAWKFECDRIAEERGKTNTPMNGCVYDERNIMQIVHGVVQGKYLPEAVNYFEKRGYSLNQSKRGVMTFKENFIYKVKRLNWPKPLKKVLKKILRIFGMKFVTDQNA